MGNQANPNVVLPLRDLSDGSLDSGKTVELIPHGDTYPTNKITLTEISTTGVYKKEEAVDTPAVAQGIYQVFVNTVLAGVYLHGGGFLQSHIDNVSDPHAVAGAQIGIADAGGYFATDNVEAALQELGAHKTATNDPHAIKTSQITDDLGVFNSSATATENQNDTPAPDINGGGTVWAEVTIPNDTTPILLDDSMDWRDRFIHIVVFARYSVVPADYIPGGINDNIIFGHKEFTRGSSGGFDQYLGGAIFYSENGSADGLSLPYGLLKSDDDDMAVYANNADGFLYINKTVTASASVYPVILKVEYSPIQNH